jgi:Predicted PP-loop superfamily ATPase
MSEAVKQGTGGLCVLKAPLLYMNKAEVVKTGLELNAHTNILGAVTRVEKHPVVIAALVLIVQMLLKQME